MRMAIRKVCAAEFRIHIRDEERARNAPAMGWHHPRRRMVQWFIRGELVALSLGNGLTGTRQFFIPGHSTDS